MKMFFHSKISQKMVLFLLFVLQIAVWLYSNRIKPSFVITPYPPTKREIEFFSFGDKQFYYRKLAFKLQNAGDKYGHLTNLKDYDYTRLIRWFKALDLMDKNSRYIPFMAGYYYSMVGDLEKRNMVTEYIVDFAKKEPEKDWRLLTTAAYIYYKSPIKNNDKVEEIGRILVNTKSAPMWARVISAFYLQSEDICNSYKLISQISQDETLASAENEGDMFLTKLLNENIERLKKAGKRAIYQCL